MSALNLEMHHEAIEVQVFDKQVLWKLLGLNPILRVAGFHCHFLNSLAHESSCRLLLTGQQLTTDVMAARGGGYSG